MGRSRPHRISRVYLTPPPEELSPPSSVEDWDAETAMDISRPASLNIPRTASPFLNTPTLADILSDTAPQPWTRSAFMAFLSQNHCLETLEFVLDAERYSTVYAQCSQGALYASAENVCEQWRKIIEAYIIPSAPREVNLPARVRDRLLSLTYSATYPIHPIELDEAVNIVRELMNDSVLVPFLESVLSAVAEYYPEAGPSEPRPSHSRLRASIEHSHYPRTSLLPPLFGKSRSGSGATSRSHSGSADSAEVDLTDDSNSPGSTPGAEPMTPPTTPPTSDFTFAPPPNTLQKAITGNGWKRVGARLGLNRKRHSPRRSTQDALDDGVAAKARSAHDYGAGKVRRAVRLRRISAPPRILKIPAKVIEESEMKNASLTSTRPVTMMPTSSPIPSLPLPEPLLPLEMDTDTDTEVSTDNDLVEDADAETVTETRQSRAKLTDCSALLDVTRINDDDDSMVTMMDDGSLTPPSSIKDAYGWEAELDRKVHCGITNSDTVCGCRHFEYRKKGSAKRSLLHRVFTPSARRVGSGL
ncbi:hypothetical protein GGR56DRAFT_662381 [Xylariaceae sp. FL0804]|nr:hypothetical protein GGR56DRAFT_662381 [Xylariaceae sp. FL0804]